MAMVNDRYTRDQRNPKEFSFALLLSSRLEWREKKINKKERNLFAVVCVVRGRSRFPPPPPNIDRINGQSEGQQLYIVYIFSPL